MTDMPGILLASGEGAIVKILFVVALIIIGLIKKFAEKPQPGAKAPPRPAPRKPATPVQHNRPTRPAQPIAQRPAMTGDSFSQPSERRILQQQRPVRTLSSVEEHVRTVRDQTDLDVVDEQEERRRQDLEQRDALRLRRLQTAAPAEADTAAIDARISHFQRMEVQQDTIARVRVDLTDHKSARHAIIFHEILSPPKALRTAPEMWDQ